MEKNNKSIIITEDEVEYNNFDYVLIYNKNTKIIKELQDGELINETNIINNIKELAEVKEGFFADWEYVGFNSGYMEDKFFNEVEEFY